jgi:hypothetical protein
VNVLRSAWIPAPPPESEPAIDRMRSMSKRRVLGQRPRAGASPGRTSRGGAFKPASLSGG